MFWFVLEQSYTERKADLIQIGTFCYNSVEVFLNLDIIDV